MSETQDKKLRRVICEQLYVDLDVSVEECAKSIGVSDKTVYRWIQAGNWNEKKTESQTLERLIDINLKRALYKGLKGFATDPTNKDLQSLVSLLKQFKEQNKPSLVYKDNVIKFLDHTVDYFLEKSMNETASSFQRCLVDLAEYLIRRQ